VGSRIDVGRRGLAALAVAAIGVGACFMSGAVAQTEHEHGGETAGILPPGDWSDAEIAFAVSLVRRTEEALPEYLTKEELAARGYQDRSTPVTPWDHWTNPAYQRDGRIVDPEAPETIVMRSTPQGYRVASAMFQLPPGQTMADIPEEFAFLPGWHDHQNLCFDGTRFAGFATNGVCSVGQLLITTPMLHVWTDDTECGHRFPGVGAGLMCEHYQHHGPDGTMPPGSSIPGGTTVPPVKGPPPSAPTTTGPPSSTPPTTGPPPSQAPEPVSAEPRYTG
jgi:hypothetical protein